MCKRSATVPFAVFFFNDTATTEIYTLSLHDALPISLRFFFIKTLKRRWTVEETPYPKRPIRLPDVLSREEVEQLINSADSPMHRMWLLTLYATGMRREELVQLKVSDIDSARMLIHIRKGKEKKD